MLSIRSFRPTDIPLGMRLKEAAGWNQTEADWRRAYELDSDYCFVGVFDGVAAATLTACRFGDVAWIAMVLTDAAFRGRGIATGLMRHAIDRLRQAGVSTIRLDATALGRPVYERLGFGVDYELRRFSGTVRPSTSASLPAGVRIRLATTADLPDLAAIDRRVAGCDRTKLLASLLEAAPQAAQAAEVAGRVAGFGLQRPGSRAIQLGPIVADIPEAGAALLAAALRDAVAGEVFVDAAIEHRKACQLASQAGLVVQRAFYRMTLGTKVVEDRESLWAAGGPEKG